MTTGRDEGRSTIRPATSGPVDLTGIFGWFAARGVPGMEVATAVSYSRLIHTSAGIAGIEIADDDGPRLTAFAENATARAEAVALARHVIDLDADSEVIDAALCADPLVAPAVAAAPGIRIPGAVSLTEILVRAILGQQVTVASARRQFAHVVGRLGDPVPESATPPAIVRNLADAGVGNHGAEPAQPTCARAFPQAATIAEHAGAVIRGPRARTDTVIRVCEAIADGALTVDDNPTVDELTDRLTAVRGIGPWTADYVAMRVLDAPDILIRKDVALLRGARALGVADSFAELADVGARFAPWRSYLSMHLWRAAA